MKKALIIVESPAKIKTLKKFLGPNYAVESSVGHIRDLPKKGFGIDIKNDFEPEYAVLEEKKDVIAKLKKAAKEATSSTSLPTLTAKEKPSPGISCLSFLPRPKPNALPSTRSLKKPS